jgi:hypothetical protein
MSSGAFRLAGKSRGLRFGLTPEADTSGGGVGHCSGGLSLLAAA